MLGKSAPTFPCHSLRFSYIINVDAVPQQCTNSRHGQRPRSGRLPLQLGSHNLLPILRSRRDPLKHHPQNHRRPLLPSRPRCCLRLHLNVYLIRLQLRRAPSLPVLSRHRRRWHDARNRLLPVLLLPPIRVALPRRYFHNGRNSRRCLRWSPGCRPDPNPTMGHHCEAPGYLAQHLLLRRPVHYARFLSRDANPSHTSRQVQIPNTTRPVHSTRAHQPRTQRIRTRAHASHSRKTSTVQHQQHNLRPRILLHKRLRAILLPLLANHFISTGLDSAQDPILHRPTLHRRLSLGHLHSLGLRPHPNARHILHPRLRAGHNRLQRALHRQNRRDKIHGCFPGLFGRFPAGAGVFGLGAE